jgi:hypothetical protein
MKRHSFDAISFFSGLVIAVIGLMFLIPNTPQELIDAITDLGSWFWPVILLAIGAAIVIPVLIPRSKDEDQSPTTR